MKGILADINIQGHVDLLVKLMQAEPWKLFWEHLNLGYFRFAGVGAGCGEEAVTVFRRFSVHCPLKSLLIQTSFVPG